ncbi:MAG: hypothetical protein H0U74_10165 [Bradymonadaceae bacterium]|nr:hypothetical protein [Lujinxingiaceae bacterium]
MPGVATASEGTFDAHVALAAQGAQTMPAPQLDYRVVARDTVAQAGPASELATGQRAAGALKDFQWERSSAGQPTVFQLLINATTTTHEDSASIAAGEERYYRMSLEAEGVEGIARTEAVLGYRRLAPTVATNAQSALTHNSAILHGELLNAGKAAATEVGFCWGTSPDEVLASSDCGVAAIAPSAGAFSLTATSLEPNTVYYFRARALSAGPIVYGETVEFRTHVAAPTNLQATTNRSDGVNLTWNASPGASNYVIYLQSGQELGSTAGTTYLHSTNNGGTIVPGVIRASLGTFLDKIALSVTPATGVPAPAQQFYVVALNGANVPSPQSDLATGQRTVGTISRQWQHKAEEEPDNFSEISTTTELVLDHSPTTGASGSRNYYRVRYQAPGATSEALTNVAAGYQAVAGDAAKHFWVPNGTVNAMARGTDTLYLGGEFDYVGPYTGAIIRLDSSGQRVAGWPEINGVVHAVVSDGAGGWIIGGLFSEVGGFSRQNLARIRNDGSVDIAWKLPVNGAVHALLIHNNLIYAGGSFNVVGLQQRNGLAAFNTNGTLTTWNPSVYTTEPGGGRAAVLALEAIGNTIYVGGGFDDAQGAGNDLPVFARANIAAFDTSGALQPENPGIVGTVHAIKALTSSSIAVGGSFTTAGGQARQNFAVFNANLVLQAFNPSFAKGIFAIATTVDRIYIGGAFNQVTINGTTSTRENIAAFSRDASPVLLESWKPNIQGTVHVIAPYADQILVGGDFTAIVVGATMYNRNRLVALSQSTAEPTFWNPGAGHTVHALARDGSQVLAAGRFNSVGGQTRKNLAALAVSESLITPNSFEGELLDWNHPTNGPVYALQYQGGAQQVLFVGGQFTQISGSPRTNLAAFSTTGLRPWSPSVNGSVLALALHPSQSTLYLGGLFTQVQGQARGKLAALSSTTSNAVSLQTWAPSLEPASGAAAYALYANANDVYIGGSFSSISLSTGVAITKANLIAVGHNNVVTSLTPTPNGPVWAIVPSGTNILIGGNFTNLGTSPKNYFARFDTTGGVPDGFGPSANQPVHAIARGTSVTYLGGAFSTLATLTRNRIGRIDASGGVETWNPDIGTGAFEPVLDLLAGPDYIYTGGAFTRTGRTSHSGFSALYP